MSIDIHNHDVADHFTANPDGSWLCLKTGKTIRGAMLGAYQSYGNAALCGLTFLGLPVSDEIPQPQYAPATVIIQFFERQCLAYDPQYVLGKLPGSDAHVKPVNLFDEGIGQDPRVAAYRATITAQQAQITALEAQQQSGDGAALAAIHQAQELFKPFS